MTDNADEVEEIKERLSNDSSDELLQSIASTIVDQMEQSFPELSFKVQDIEDTIEAFREQKLEEIESERQYSTKIDYIVEYFVDEVGVETTDDLTSEDIGHFDTWRKYESLDREEPISNKTLSDDMYLFDEFISYMIEHKLVPVRFIEQVEQPDVNPEKGDGVSEKKLDPELAKASLEYLRRTSMRMLITSLWNYFAGQPPGGVAWLAEIFRSSSKLRVMMSCRSNTMRGAG